MKDVRFICLQCKHSFTERVLEPGEAEDRNIRGYPVRCPRCGGHVRQDR